MATKSAREAEAHGVALQHQIEARIAATQEKAAARQKQERAFLLALGSECGHILTTARGSVTAEMVADALERCVDEEDVEDECVRRYKSYLTERAVLFSRSAVALSGVVGLLSRLHHTVDNSRSTKESILKVDSRTDSTESTAKELDGLLQAISTLDSCISSTLQDLYNSDSARTADSTEMSTNHLKERDAAARDAVRHGLKERAFFTARLRELDGLLQRLRHTTCAHPQLGSAGDDHSAATATDRLIREAQESLLELQRIREILVGKTESIDAARVSLLEESHAFNRDTDALERATEATVLITKEREEQLLKTENTCSQTADELRCLQRRQSEQKELLRTSETAYKSLSDELSRKAAAECAYAEKIEEAELLLHELQSSLRHSSEQNSTLADECAALEVKIGETEALNSAVLSEVNYLEALAPHDRAFHSAKGETSGLDTSLTPHGVTQNYLAFVQHARSSGRAAERRLRLS